MTLFLIFIFPISHSQKISDDYDQISFPKWPQYDYDTIIEERKLSSDFGVVKNGEKYLRLNISIIDLKVNTRQRV